MFATAEQEKMDFLQFGRSLEQRARARLEDRLEYRRKTKLQLEEQLRSAHPEFFVKQTGRIIKVEREDLNNDSGTLRSSLIYTIEVDSAHRPKVYYYDRGTKRRFGEGNQVRFRFNKDYSISDLELVL